MFFHSQGLRSRSVPDNPPNHESLFISTKVLTGAVPFSNKPPRAALSVIAGGERPPHNQPTLL